MSFRIIEVFFAQRVSSFCHVQFDYVFANDFIYCVVCVNAEQREMSRGAPVVCRRHSDDKARERRRRATQCRDDAPLSDPRRRQRAARGDTVQVLSADTKQTEPGEAHFTFMVMQTDTRSAECRPTQ